MRFKSRFQRLIHSRWFLFGLVLVIYALYFPIGQYASAQPTHDVSLVIDDATPLLPDWIFIYAMIYLTGFVPFAVVRQHRIFIAAVKAYLLTMLIAFTIFLFFPVSALHRPHSFPIDSFASWGLKFCYVVDTQANCFPSLHVAVSFLAAFATLKSDKLVGGITLILSFLIAASTLLVKQHYFVDVVFGFSLAEMGRRVFLKSLVLRPDERLSKVPGRRGALMILLIYSLCIGGFYILYAMGWQPWD